MLLLVLFALWSLLKPALYAYKKSVKANLNDFQQLSKTAEIVFAKLTDIERQFVSKNLVDWECLQGMWTTFSPPCFLVCPSHLFTFCFLSDVDKICKGTMATPVKIERLIKRWKTDHQGYCKIQSTASNQYLARTWMWTSVPWKTKLNAGTENVLWCLKLYAIFSKIGLLRS